MPSPIGLHLALVLAVATFAIAPQLDVAVSSVFYRIDAGFWLAAIPALKVLREVFRAAENLFGVAGGLVLLMSLWLGPGRRIPARLWGFWCGAMALGPGIAVNAAIKPFWGRARPADTTLFGGHDTFTPALLPTDQCSWGCSFVSGEAAGAAGLAIVVGVLIWPMLAPRSRGIMLAGLGAFVVLVSGLRIAMGRHFLSDVVFGWLVAAYTAWILYEVLRIREARQSLTPETLLSDLKGLAARMSARRRG